MGRHKRFMMALPRKWNPQARLCAMALFCHAKDDGTGIYAGVTRLCEISGLSRSGLMRALKFLADNQFLSSDGEHVHENGARTTLRRLNLREILDESEREKTGSAMDGTSPTHDDSWSHSCENHSPMDGTQTESINQEIKPRDITPIVPKPNSKAPAVVIPEWVPSEAWNGFLEMRKKIKKPLTDRGVALALKKLGQLRDEGHDPSAVLDQSVMSNYQGLFPVKGDFSSGAGHRRQSAADLAEQNAIRMMQRMGMNR